MHFTAYYSHHEPKNILNNPQDIVFVKDGLHWYALFLTPIWLLIHKMWLFFAIYCAILIMASQLDKTLIANGDIASVIQITTHIVFFIFSPELRSIYLRKKNFKIISSAVGANLADAEYRFFAQLIEKEKKSPKTQDPKTQDPKTQNPETKHPDPQKYDEDKDIIANPGA